MTIFDTRRIAWRVARRYVVACCVTGVAVTMPGTWAFGQGAAPDPEEEVRWAVVQDYLDERDGWTERTGIPVGAPPFGRGPGPEAEPAPDPTPAAHAARAIVAAGGERTFEAAVFLIESAPDRSMVSAAEMARMLERSAATQASEESSSDAGPTGRRDESSVRAAGDQRGRGSRHRDRLHRDGAGGGAVGLFVAAVSIGEAATKFLIAVMLPLLD